MVTHSRIILFIVLTFVICEGARWSFDTITDNTFSSDTSNLLFSSRKAQLVHGIIGNAVHLTRQDALMSDSLIDFVSRGYFTVQFWMKVSWASRRFDHGDIINFVSSSQILPCTWRIGFASISECCLPRNNWPLTLRIGNQVDTKNNPVYVEPDQWVHIAFIGDGKKVSIYRNGGCLGSTNFPDTGLIFIENNPGCIQINGSAKFFNPYYRENTWECDISIDDLIISRDTAQPEFIYPNSLQSSSNKFIAERAKLFRIKNADKDDIGIVNSLLSQAEQFDNGEDTKSIQDSIYQICRRSIKAIKKGDRPLTRETGHLKLSFRSEIDQSQQFYEVYIPKNKKGKRYPLVVALHGSGEDESVFFYRYDLETLSEQYGWIILTPYGRGQSRYRDAGEGDIYEAINSVKRQWDIDTARIYGVGHSMGASGIIALAIRQPQYFAAIAPIAGYIDSNSMTGLRNVPLLWIAGEKDNAWATGSAKRMMEFSKRTDALHEFILLPGYGHGGFTEFDSPTIVEVMLPDVFAFFNKHKLNADLILNNR